MAVTRVRLDYLRPIPNFRLSLAGGFDLYWGVTTIGHWTPSFMPEYASEEPGAVWTPLLDAPTESLSALAVGPKRAALYIPWIFRLKVYDGASLVLTSEPRGVQCGLNRHDYLIWREIVRRNALGLRKYQGNQGYLLRRRSTGSLCSECRDEVIGGEAKSDCTTCYGTGYTGGYFPPQYMPGDWESAPPSGYNMSLSENGPQEQHVSQLRTLADPACEFKDVWVDISSNYRYEIQKIDLSEYRGVPTSQLLDVSKLPASNIVYKFPINTQPPAIIE